MAEDGIREVEVVDIIKTEGGMTRIRSHPGEVLLEEFLKPLGMSKRALSAALQVPANRISEIVRGRRDVSADTAIRLARYFGTSPEFWLNLQIGHDLSKVAAEHGREIARQVKPRAEAA